VAQSIRSVNPTMLVLRPDESRSPRRSMFPGAPCAAFARGLFDVAYAIYPIRFIARLISLCGRAHFQY